MWSSWSTLTDSVVFCLCLSVVAYAGTPIYTYTDDAGTHTFTTELDSIPKKYRSRIVQLHLDSSSTPPAPAVLSPQRPPPRNVRTVTATGEYRMNDHDTRTTAVRLAIEAAKRDALEQVATYVESVTEVTQMQVMSDETRTYTAGLVMVLDQQITTRLETSGTVVIQADLTAQVDPDDVVQAIMGLRVTHGGTQIYSYMEDSGTQTFTNVLGTIPEKYRSRAHLQLHFNSPTPPSVPEVHALLLETPER